MRTIDRRRVVKIAERIIDDLAASPDARAMAASVLSRCVIYPMAFPVRSMATRTATEPKKKSKRITTKGSSR